jgi:two-component system sensor kinase FixL
LCGTSHLMSIWVLWHPNYYIEGWIKAATAVVSIATLVVIIIKLPQALRLPSPKQQAELNEKLQEVNARLEAQHALNEDMYRNTLTAVVDNMVDGIVTIDETGKITSFNRACTQIFGYEAREVIGKNIMTLMPDPNYSEHDTYLSNYLTTGAAGREANAVRKDGTVFPVDLSVSAFTIGGVQYFSGIIRDITKIKQAEDNRQNLLLRLTESNTELERFAYVASHDMQEPLRMVLNFSQIIVNDYGDRLDDEGREYLSIVSDSAQRMRDMVQDLLEYARLGSEGLRYTKVDLAVELSHVLENLREMIRDTQAIITYDPMPKLFGNAVQLMRLLQNLIANAIKYQHPDRKPVIHVGVVNRGDMWEICVEDNGMGIDARYVQQVFEPFRRLHNWDIIKGTGLGLSVCKKIAEHHGGQIWVESTPGVGSRFYFTLSKERRAI